MSMTIKVYEVNRHGFTTRVVKPKTEVAPADFIPLCHVFPACWCKRCTGTTGWCDWHKGPSGTAVPIDVISEGSGTATPRYACAPCREQRGLRLASEQR
ncbi:hypothetical protein ACF08M_01515 [Streptomyces sp. NPDC015032]|uniref:hypothetical protein n=1 Tax=Streptomyces sp. NPDC015032 TaxID=3364937 RepID=UPI0036FA7B70